MRALLDNLPGLLHTVTAGGSVAPGAPSQLPKLAPGFGDDLGSGLGFYPDDDSDDDPGATYDESYYGAYDTGHDSEYDTGYDGAEGYASHQPAPDPIHLLDGLNEQQARAVTHLGGPLLIIAGAGSGKTRVLTHRIAYLIATKKAWPSQILAITFTNKAAAEMRERVIRLIGSEGEKMWVSTFHSACVRILRREYSHLGLKSSFSIYDAADSLRLVTNCAKAQDLDPKKFPPRSLANKISDLKNELITPANYEAAPGRDRVLSEVYAEYQKRLKQANALDFDDIIMSTVTLLQQFPAVAEHYRRRFRHILVDEYQDTNHAQYMLIKELVGGPGSSGYEQQSANLPPGGLTVVGDSDQSIYAFRGATIRNIEEFEKDYPNAETVLLEQNYRSTQNVLRAANAVISANQGRRPKKLWTASGDGPKLTGYVADDEYSEARYIASEIDRLRDNEGVREGDVAIFYRANAQSRAIEEILIRVGLPYKVIGGTRFYERKEIKDAIAYLRALANPDDEINLRRILNVPKRAIGDRTEAL
ncbi:MAG: UvrD-helicase domain-containing protein, partial [Cellulomonadaceae bacterium]|nr:UvrD-helicase domain-containing protein [Cellulomonadaceae bacterium]